MQLTLQDIFVYKEGAVTYFFLTLKVLFSKVGIITKFLNSMFLKLKKYDHQQTDRQTNRQIL